jgi:hypothetical protein
MFHNIHNRQGNKSNEVESSKGSGEEETEMYMLLSNKSNDNKKNNFNQSCHNKMSHHKTGRMWGQVVYE